MSENTAPNKYRSLISNTVIFGISTFGSKVLVLLLTPLITRVLEPGTMGVADLIISICNLILPVMYLCIAESVIRFGMDRSYKKSDVFSVGLITVLIGYGVLWLFFPLFQKIEDLSGFVWLVYLYVLTSALRTLITNFIRSTGHIRLFAIDGIFTTFMYIVFSLLFLLRFEMGIAGYVLGTVVADGVSALCLFFMMRLHRFVKFRGISHSTIKEMFAYALPLIPTAVSWWVTNLSDRVFVRYICGGEIQGIYSQSYKIPNLITLISAFFTRAWELSAFSEYQSEEGERFFSNVFRSYYTFVLLVASALILLIKPFTRLLLGPKYFESWRFSLYLLLAVAVSCLVTFLGAIYNAAKKNLMVSVTTVIGAAVNIALNATLIPISGAEGAAFATFISFLVVFVIRAVDTRRYIRIRMQPWRMIMTLLLLLAQVTVALAEKPFWILWECLIFALILISNFGYVLFVLRKAFAMLRGRRSAK